VVGLNFDFVVLNFTKHTSYLIYNAALYFSPVVQKQYHEKYGYDEVPSNGTCIWKEGLTGPFVVAAESEDLIIIILIIIIMFCNIAVDFSQGEEEWSSTWKKKMKKREC
jgi:hypothetical protein